MSLTAAQRRTIHDLAAQGYGQREIARRARVSHTTVARVLRAPAPVPHAELVARYAGAHATTPSPDPPDPSTPAIDHVRAMLADSRARVEGARATGDAQLAQRATRDAAALAAVLARLETREAADADVVRVTRAEVDEARRRVREWVDALAARGGLRCADCDRALSVSYGGEKARKYGSS